MALFDVRHAPIAANSQGEHTVVSAVAGKKIVVLQYVLTEGAGAFRFKSGSTPLSGEMRGPATGSDAFTVEAWHGVLRTAEGEALVISFAAGAAPFVNGHLTYFLE